MFWFHGVKIVLLLISLAHFVFGHSFRIISFRHEVNEKYIKCTSLAVVDQILNGCIVLAQDMEKFRLKFEAVANNRNGKPWTLFNLTLDGCSLLGEGKAGKSIYIVDRILAALKQKNPRMPHRCPMKKDVDYCYDNFTFPSGKQSRFVPRLRSTAMLTLVYKNIPTYKLIFEVDMSSK